ncbi:riboflavin kinase [Amycolatopsis jiangsuensis]|uniref:riboflavin kinase n=1 Tax=Amycolatopsis jiangsuensis TaxID=1181879 RepID=A0A840ITT2_9PSEU|nr:riboflavin kinase [Amycolatopsis jiangsuensis]MBB4684865.1 riboflavin kinase/FMN adenylyltransferase [Amycolatopsis jiangsuensis]
MADESYFVVRGRVEPGDQRGRELGFPTANIALRDQRGELGDGVWAGWVERPDGTRVAAAVSVGRRPTYYGADGYRLVEAFLLDFAGDLYGESLTVWLGRHLREQKAYGSAEELIEALARDVETTRGWVAEHPAATLPSLSAPPPDGEVLRVG